MESKIMPLIDFSKNGNYIEKESHIASILLFGNPNAYSDAQITICIPVYKRYHLIKKAIESAVNQDTDIPYQIIVVDDDPDFNNTQILEIVKSFGIDNLTYYKNRENLKLFGNLNRCGILAKTKYFALLHDDDFLMPDYIDTVMSVLTKRNVDALCVAFKQLNNPFLINIPNESMGENKNKAWFIIKKIISKMFFFNFHNRSTLVKIPLTANMFLDNVYGPPTCGMIFKRESFLKSGGYNQEYYPTDDWIFMIFYSKHYTVIRLKKELAFYIWENNLSTQKKTLDEFQTQRNQIINSLVKQDALCRFLFNCLRRDFKKKMESRIETTVSYGRLFNLVSRIFYLKLIPC
ncbi:MAG: glycosyltransferase [Bacteroidales bacterium]|jgi:glycosyltransferase involved in cell wall biosynthesis|nr:glycosyltransferase [Bacteroidales bacterium]